MICLKLRFTMYFNLLNQLFGGILDVWHRLSADE